LALPTAGNRPGGAPRGKISQTIRGPPLNKIARGVGGGGPREKKKKKKKN